MTTPAESLTWLPIPTNHLFIHFSSSFLGGDCVSNRPKRSAQTSLFYSQPQIPAPHGWSTDFPEPTMTPNVSSGSRIWPGVSIQTDISDTALAGADSSFTLVYWSTVVEQIIHKTNTASCTHCSIFPLTATKEIGWNWLKVHNRTELYNLAHLVSTQIIAVI